MRRGTCTSSSSWRTRASSALVVPSRSCSSSLRRCNSTFCSNVAFSRPVVSLQRACRTCVADLLPPSPHAHAHAYHKTWAQHSRRRHRYTKTDRAHLRSAMCGLCVAQASLELRHSRPCGSLVLLTEVGGHDEASRSHTRARTRVRVRHAAFLFCFVSCSGGCSQPAASA